jgi:hypothetical protein
MTSVTVAAWLTPKFYRVEWNEVRSNPLQHSNCNFLLVVNTCDVRKVLRMGRCPLVQWPTAQHGASTWKSVPEIAYPSTPVDATCRRVPSIALGHWVEYLAHAVTLKGRVTQVTNCTMNGASWNVTQLSRELTAWVLRAPRCLTI